MQNEIDELKSQIRDMKDYLPRIVQKIEYRSVQEFLGIVRNPDKDGYVRFFENENGEIFAIGYGGRMLPRVKD